IYGMSLALDECQQNLQKEASKLANLRDYFESTLLQNLPQVHIQGDRESRVSNTSNVLIEGVDGESLLFNLDLEGIAASAGAACESGSLDPSHVILAMGFSEAEAKASIRFSFDRSNTMEEVDRLLEVLSRLVFRLRKV
ncbi:MAG: aminotransferase class V-fold PLP-dependent enzyme, partial [Deltaproteobacteria bacterium]|nr:aminotransferase class V-fold PLP-dependent enzyme [Deltaproteobacteria bacterium]